jgi:CBS domain-containing protein
MSPRAACRLATLGFERVHDYVVGKVDWLARGLPREGTKAHEPRAVDATRTDLVTCARRDRAGSVLAAVETSPFGFALVLGEDRVLLGRVGRTALRADPARAVEEIMQPGPSTIRANVDPAAVAARLIDKRHSSAIVTDPDGRLLGVVTPDDLRELISGASGPPGPPADQR